jgi:hypothetical protein
MFNVRSLSEAEASYYLIFFILKLSEPEFIEFFQFPELPFMSIKHSFVF